MEYTKEGVRVDPCRHGLGVFALRSLITGDVMGPIQGEIVADRDYGSEFAIDLGDRALEPAAPFRFLNHSCRPNCELVICEEEDEDGTPRDPTVWLDILSEIAAGEPMTIDYAWPAKEAIPCQCGTASCRGWIVAEENLDEVRAAQHGSLAALDSACRDR
jgi:SET domain-containing protein